MKNCDICGVMTEGVGELDVEGYGEYSDCYEGWRRAKVSLPITCCEICDLHIKRASHIAEFINDIATQQINKIKDIAQNFENLFQKGKKDIFEKEKHLIDTKYAHTEVRIMECLKELDKRLEEKNKACNTK